MSAFAVAIGGKAEIKELFHYLCFGRYDPNAMHDISL